MRSDEERKIFEDGGWTYNYVTREWVAPDGFRLSLDALMVGQDVLGPEVERRIRRQAQEHGR